MLESVLWVDSRWPAASHSPTTKRLSGASRYYPLTSQHSGESLACFVLFKYSLHWPVSFSSIHIPTKGVLSVMLAGDFSHTPFVRVKNFSSIPNFPSIF